MAKPSKFQKEFWQALHDLAQGLTVGDVASVTFFWTLKARVRQNFSRSRKMMRVHPYVARGGAHVQYERG